MTLRGRLRSALRRVIFGGEGYRYTVVDGERWVFEVFVDDRARGPLAYRYVCVNAYDPRAPRLVNPAGVARSTRSGTLGGRVPSLAEHLEEVMRKAEERATYHNWPEYDEDLTAVVEEVAHA